MNHYYSKEFQDDYNSDTKNIIFNIIDKIVYAQT